MGFTDSISRHGSFEPTLRAGATGVPAAGFLPTLGSTPSATGLQISQGTAMAVSTVYACVMDIAESFARCTPRLFKEAEGRSGDPVTDHPVAKLFKRPNWVQTWYEFAVQMAVAYKLRNNAYAVILRNDSGDPVALIPVNPDAVMVLEAADGSIFYNINRLGLFQIAALRDLPTAIPAEDVLHFRNLTFNMLVGASTIGLARDSIGVAMGLEQQAARFMANAARPSGVLKASKQLTPEAATRLRDQWESFRSGLQNTGRTAILEDGLEWQSIQLTSVDLEFIEQRKFSIEDTARWFGVPLYRIGGDIGKIKPDEADQAYVNRVIMPMTEAFEQKFVMHFGLDDDGLVADFDERNLLRASEATRINNQRLKVMSGLATPNECRKEEGMPPLTGGDELMFPVNSAALGSDMTGTAPDGAGRPNSGQLPDPGAADTKPKGEDE